MTDAQIYYGPGSRAARRRAGGLLERAPGRPALTIDLRDRGERVDPGSLDPGSLVDIRPIDPHLVGSQLVDEVAVDPLPIDPLPIDEVVVAEVSGAVADEVRAAGAATRGRSVLALLAGLAIIAAAVALGVTLLGRPLGLAAVAVVLVATGLGYRFVVQPWHLRWGADDAEVDAEMPGDELLDDAPATTRAVTVDAPVEQVWEWLVQLGIGPNGWIAPGPLDADPSDTRIVPRLRNLGGARSRAVPGTGFEVHRIESPSTIVSQGPDGTTWCLQVVDVGNGRSRLVSRFRSRFDPVPAASMVLADPVAFLSERRMLRDVKARAESGAPLQRLECPCVP